ncbi:hypothetical protein IJI94_01460 [Candidatus Saccharibacteria bacterium]|nr:hypothetical protein [Candidatus Saccharibacteria bacterium]
MNTKSYKIFHIDNGPTFESLADIRNEIKKGTQPNVTFDLNDDNVTINAYITNMRLDEISTVIDGFVTNGEYKGQSFRVFYNTKTRTGTLSI